MSRCPWASWRHIRNMHPGTVVKQFYSDMSFSLSGWINNMFLNLLPAPPHNHLLYYIFANVRKSNGRYRFIWHMACWVFTDSSKMRWYLKKGDSRRRNCCRRVLSGSEGKKSPCTITFFLPFLLFSWLRGLRYINVPVILTVPARAEGRPRKIQFQALEWMV